jgi:6-phosphogluconate dehydrogenase
MQQADIGLIGLAVMGQNLALNMSDHGFRVAVYNRTASRTDQFLDGPALDSNITAAYALAELANQLSRPRKVMLMVKAGEPVDRLIEQLLPHLEPDDIIIDGGNSHFSDTERRALEVAHHGLRFLGLGISGGEEGARNGPSIMPGGDPAAWPEVQELFQTIAAQVDGEPCCRWVGENGAGHYVKMVHNGIEYGDMQLISEAFHLMHAGFGISHDEMQEIFTQWNRGVLNSYLIEITADILSMMDTDGTPLLERILDSAQQKGTGRWTGISALELGVPLTLINEAVFARNLSARKEERIHAAQRIGGHSAGFNGERAQAIHDLHNALYAAKITSYAQGFMLMREAANSYGWKLNFGDIALIWRGGCIIRSRFLNNINDAYQQNPDLENLLLDDFFLQAIQGAEAGWRSSVMLGIELGIPMPAFSSALAFFDGYRCSRLPANLLQAQRDYFGAHTYERTDRPRGEFFHTDWISKGKP